MANPRGAGSLVKRRTRDAALERGATEHYRDADYYDHAYRSRKLDIAHYVALAKRAGGPVLELGVGTGRVARAIAAEGIEVVGVDAMESMLEGAGRRLERAPRHVRDRVKLVRGDLRSLRLGRRFPLVIAPFNVFMHLYDASDLERAFATVDAHLARGGTFAFDVLMPVPDFMTRDPARIYRCGFVKPRGRPRARYGEAFAYDPVRQVQHITMVFEPEDERVAPTIQRLSQRQFFPEELVALVRHAGFEVVERYGDFDHRKFARDADAQVLVLERAKATRARARRSST